MAYFTADKWGNNDHLAQGIQRAYAKAKEALRPRWSKWKAAFLYMHCMHNDETMGRAVQAAGRDNPYESALFRPLFPQQVLTAHPRIKDAMKGMDPPFRAVPDVDSPEQDGPSLDPALPWAEAARYQHWLAYQLARHIQWGRLLDPLVMEALIYGTAVVRLLWRKRYGLKWGMESVPGAEGRTRLAPVAAPRVKALEGVQAKEVVENHIAVELVDRWRVFPDPQGCSVRGPHDSQPFRYVIETDKALIEDIVAAIVGDPMGGWQYPEEGPLRGMAEATAQSGASAEGDRAFADAVREWLKDFEGTAELVDSQRHKLEVQVKKIGGSAGTSDEEDRQSAGLMTFWGGGIDPWYIVRIGSESSGTVLRKLKGQDHPSIFAPIPHVFFTPRRLAREPWGMGLIDLLEGLQRELNGWTNLTMTGFAEAVHGITLCDTTKGIFADQLLAQPSRVLEVANLGGHPLTEFVYHIERPMPDIGMALQMLNMIRDEGNLTGGTTDDLRGAIPQLSGATARGSLLAVEQGNRQWGGQVELMGSQASEFGEVMHGFNRQYLTEDMMFRRTDLKGPESVVPLPAKIVQRRYELIFCTLPIVVNEGVQLTAHTQFETMFLQHPDFEASRAIVKHARLLHDPDPEGWVKKHPIKPQLENAFFLENGYFPWPPGRDDDHLLHDRVHGELEPAVRDRPDVEQQLLIHRQAHAQLMGGPMAGAPQQPQFYPGMPGSPASGPVPVAPPPGMRG